MMPQIIPTLQFEVLTALAGKVMERYFLHLTNHTIFHQLSTTLQQKVHWEPVNVAIYMWILDLYFMPQLWTIQQFIPFVAAHSHDAMRPSSIAPAPSSLSSFRGPTKKWVHGPASSPFIPFHRHHHVRNKSRNSGSGPAYRIPAPSNSQQGFVLSLE